MKNKLKMLLKKIGIYTNAYEKGLLKLEKEIKTIASPSNCKKVLFTQSFSIYPPCFVHDKVMAFALKLRGFEIHATFCDGVQSTECNVYGGVWGGGKNFEKNCENCQKKSAEEWSFINPNAIYKYSKYLNQNDRDKVESIIKSIPKGKWLKYSENGWDIGSWAKDILVNNYVVGDYLLIDNHEALGVSHLKNLLLVKIACERIIETVKPDRIISNDSFYGMWKIWELLAKRYAIPFYSHWSGTRVGGWSYAHNDASMNLDFSKSWGNYSKINLTESENQRIENWLEARMAGKEMIIDTASSSSYKTEKYDLLQINPEKPTALLSANVIWDLTALNKEIFTSSMSEWIVETIKWFVQHPEYQLIIKPHPVETHPSIPQTKETVLSIIEKQFLKLPNNIFVLSPKVSLSVYDFFPISKIGLVFTTSVGMEMAARGIPVITAGRSHYRGYGFTTDPTSKEEYFAYIDGFLSRTKNIEVEKTKDLAKKFMKFNFFHYYTKIGIVDFSFGNNQKNTLKMNINSIDQLNKGHNQHFDYILNCIEKGEAILSDTSWPSES